MIVMRVLPEPVSRKMIEFWSLQASNNFLWYSRITRGGPRFLLLITYNDLGHTQKIESNLFFIAIIPQLKKVDILVFFLIGYPIPF